MIYLDCAATSRILPKAKEAMLYIYDKWGSEFANCSAQYNAGKKSNQYLNKLRARLYEIFNIPENYVLVFTSCASESNSLIFHSSKLPILVDRFSHPSCKNFPSCKLFSLGKLEEYIKEQSSLVSLSLVQHETGMKYDHELALNLSKKYNSKLHIDASQVKKIDVKNLNADYITISSHKLGGPIGIAAVISKSLLNAQIFGGSQEFNMRAGTQALPLITGFVEACSQMQENDFFEDHFKELKNYMKKLIDSNYFLENLINAEFVDNIVCLVLDKIPSSELAAFMDLNGIAIGIGSACKSGSLDGMDAIVQLNLEENAMLYKNAEYNKLSEQNVVRISFDFATTKNDIEIFANKFNEFMKVRAQ